MYFDHILLKDPFWAQPCQYDWLNLGLVYVYLVNVCLRSPDFLRTSSGQCCGSHWPMCFFATSISAFLGGLALRPNRMACDVRNPMAPWSLELIPNGGCIASSECRLTWRGKRTTASAYRLAWRILFTCTVMAPMGPGTVTVLRAR